jgi:outer membrane protein OmpA-like peptidoglycan-associated protein
MVLWGAKAMKFYIGLFSLFTPVLLFSQNTNYRHPSILGAGFFINSYPENNSRNLDPGIGIAYYFPISKLLDCNVNLNSSFTENFEKGAMLPDKKRLLLETSGLVRLRMLAKPSWAQPFLVSGLGALQFKNNYVGFLPFGVGVEFNYKNIFLIPTVQYHSPFSSSFNNGFHFNISVLGTVSWKGKKVSAHKPNPSANTLRDKDGDGIIDIDDVCPDVPGILAFLGCPDSDNDGIQDKEDECPRVFGIIKYKGCPIPDTDKDGINDEEDSCILTPGVIRYHGCPIPDTDLDGMNDEEDSCIRIPGPITNKGCPIVAKELTDEMQKAAKNIFFETGSYKLLSRSFSALDNVVRILKEKPDLKLIIEGHTDNRGTGESNQILSENRAKAVLNYLLGKGVSPTRLISAGYGQDRPIGDNNTSNGRANNRRVEMKLYYW